MEAIFLLLLSIFLLTIFVLSPNLITVYVYGIKINSILENPTSNVIESIYQFGDSISDTGNAIRESHSTCSCAFKPYGKTLLRHPTGRCSDGLLIIDFIAQALNVPLVEPYLDIDGDFRHGVNFAVAGATSLNVSTLATKGIFATATNSSILLQLDWFKSHLKTICASTSPLECEQKLANAIFFVGEIGGNDYNSGAIGGKSIADMQSLVPVVVQTISNVVKEVIGLGAKRVIVPGNFPVGCMTVYLAAFKSTDPTMYDELHCLKSWNDFSALHNTQLQNAINDLQKQNPNVAIVYADYFNAMRSVLTNAASQGFDQGAMLKACCGAGEGDYNFDGSRMCGSKGAVACADPSKHVSWDGIHLTEHAYQLMADQLLKSVLPALAMV